MSQTVVSCLCIPNIETCTTLCGNGFIFTVCVTPLEEMYNKEQPVQDFTKMAALKSNAETGSED
jgi:hypothetical protein